MIFTSKAVKILYRGNFHSLGTLNTLRIGLAPFSMTDKKDNSSKSTKENMPKNSNRTNFRSGPSLHRLGTKRIRESDHYKNAILPSPSSSPLGGQKIETNFDRSDARAKLGERENYIEEKIPQENMMRSSSSSPSFSPPSDVSNWRIPNWSQFGTEAMSLEQNKQTSSFVLDERARQNEIIILETAQKLLGRECFLEGAACQADFSTCQNGVCRCAEDFVQANNLSLNCSLYKC